MNHPLKIALSGVAEHRLNILLVLRKLLVMIFVDYCKEVGHWVENCPKLRQKYSTANTWTKDVTQRKFDVDDRTETQVLNSPSKNKCQSGAYLEIRLHTRRMCALLDTGYDHSVIGRNIIPSAFFQPTNERLYTADGTE